MNLTPKQTAVVKRLAENKTIKEIAHNEGVSPKAIEHRWMLVKRRLGISTYVQATHYAIRTGLTPILFMLTLVCNAQLPPLPHEVVVTPQQSVSLAWDRAPDAAVKGYWIYYGWVSRTYTNSVNVGNVTNTTLRVPRGADYFSATAYYTNGLEGDFSVEVHFVPTVTPAKTNLWIQFARQYAPSVTGPWLTDAASIVNVTNPVGNRFAREQIKETQF